MDSRLLKTFHCLVQEDGFEHAAQAARIEAAKRESKLRAQLAQEAKVSSQSMHAHHGDSLQRMQRQQEPAYSTYSCCPGHALVVAEQACRGNCQL